VCYLLYVISYKTAILTIGVPTLCTLVSITTQIRRVMPFMTMVVGFVPTYLPTYLPIYIMFNSLTITIIL